MLYFARPSLAAELADQLEGRAVFGDARTGCSRPHPPHGQVDVPATRSQTRTGVTQRARDLHRSLVRPAPRPGDLIAETIARELQQHLGVVAKTAGKAGGKRDHRRHAQGRHLGYWEDRQHNLVRALRTLHETAGRPIALIIDEAQHA